MWRNNYSAVRKEIFFLQKKILKRKLGESRRWILQAERS